MPRLRAGGRADAFATFTEDLEPCPFCACTFLPDRLAVHLRSCAPAPSRRGPTARRLAHVAEAAWPLVAPRGGSSCPSATCAQAPAREFRDPPANLPRALRARACRRAANAGGWRRRFETFTRTSSRARTAAGHSCPARRAPSSCVRLRPPSVEPPGSPKPSPSLAARSRRAVRRRPRPPRRRRGRTKARRCARGPASARRLARRREERRRAAAAAGSDGARAPGSDAKRNSRVDLTRYNSLRVRSTNASRQHTATLHTHLPSLKPRTGRSGPTSRRPRAASASGSAAARASPRRPPPLPPPRPAAPAPTAGRPGAF